MLICSMPLIMAVSSSCWFCTTNTWLMNGFTKLTCFCAVIFCSSSVKMTEMHKECKNNVCSTGYMNCIWSLHLFPNDPHNEDDEGPFWKKRQRLIENKTRFSNSKVTYFPKAKKKQEAWRGTGIVEIMGVAVQIWNQHLLAVRNPVIDVHSDSHDFRNPCSSSCFMSSLLLKSM